MQAETGATGARDAVTTTNDARRKPLPRWTLLCALACLACGDDKGGGGGSGGGSTGSLTGRILSADDDQPLAGIRIRSAQLDRTSTSGADGRFTIEVPKQNARVTLEGSDTAPVTKAGWGAAEISLRMKRYDAIGVVQAALGGMVQASGSRAAVRFRAGVLTGADSAEVVMAAPDVRRATAMRAVSGSYSATQNGTAGKISIASPLYVRARSADIKLMPAAKIEIDFPAWAPSASASRLALYAYDEEKDDWTQAGEVTAMTRDGEPIFRAESDRFGWLAVGEFYSDLACVEVCAKDAKGAAVRDAEAAATGADHFSQVLGTTDEDGCVEFRVRANAQVRLEVRTPAGALLQKQVNTGAAGSACTNAGVLGGAPATDLAAAEAAFVSNFEECGMQGTAWLRGALEEEAVNAGPKALDVWIRQLKCYADLPCNDFVGIWGCGPDDSAADVCERIGGYADAEDDDYDLMCADGAYAYACDGEADCADGSDEVSQTCKDWYHYKCKDQELYFPREVVCNGESECPMGDDEASCLLCDGQSYPPHWKCDGYDDCNGGVDEEGCPEEQEEAVDQITCPDGSSAWDDDEVDVSSDSNPITGDKARRAASGGRLSRGKPKGRAPAPLLQSIE